MRTAVTLSFDHTWADVLVFSGVLALVGAILWLVYVTMQHPRLPVIRRPDEAPRVSWLGGARYVVTTVIMMNVWMLVILTLLSAAAIDRSAEEVVLATAAVIGASRILAHIHQEIAHEIAKTVPIAILSFILVGGGFAGADRFEQVYTELTEGAASEIVNSYFLGLITLDLLVTCIWFFFQRHNWQRARRRAEEGEPRLGAMRRTWRSLRRLGYE